MADGPGNPNDNPKDSDNGKERAEEEDASMRTLTLLVELRVDEKVSIHQLLKAIQEGCGRVRGARLTGNGFEVTMADMRGKGRLKDGVMIGDIRVVGRELNRKEIVVSFMTLPVYTHDREIQRKLEGWGVRLAGPIKRRAWPGTSVYDGTRICHVEFGDEVTSLPYSARFDTVAGPGYFRVVHDNQIRLCRQCMKPGHIMRECPDFKCHHCGEQGHYARDCVLRRGANNARDANEGKQRPNEPQDGQDGGRDVPNPAREDDAGQTRDEGANRERDQSQNGGQHDDNTEGGGATDKAAGGDDDGEQQTAEVNNNDGERGAEKGDGEGMDVTENVQEGGDQSGGPQQDESQTEDVPKGPRDGGDGRNADGEGPHTTVGETEVPPATETKEGGPGGRGKTRVAHTRAQSAMGARVGRDTEVSNIEGGVKDNNNNASSGEARHEGRAMDQGEGDKPHVNGGMEGSEGKSTKGTDGIGEGEEECDGSQTESVSGKSDDTASTASLNESRVEAMAVRGIKGAKRELDGGKDVKGRGRKGRRRQ